LYPHAYEGNYVAQQYLPDELVGTTYYEVSDNGYEKKIKERLKVLKKQRKIRYKTSCFKSA